MALSTEFPHDSDIRNTRYDPALDLASYAYPHLDLLDQNEDSPSVGDDTFDLIKNKIIETFRYSNIHLDTIASVRGPSLTLYEFKLPLGTKVSKVKSLEDDLALQLASKIKITGPIPGKGTMGVEVPHLESTLVSLQSVFLTEEFQSSQYDLPIAIGKSMDNRAFIVDLTKLPHLLIAGATGQGKSVCLNAILLSLLYKKHPSQVKLILIDINQLELSLFAKIKNHFLATLPGEVNPIAIDKLKAINTLNSLLIELDQRYDLLKTAGVRNIKEYNDKFISRRLEPNNLNRFLPFLVVVIDEFAELLDIEKRIELVVDRLAQLGRAAGIHLIISTQQPNVRVITGPIKANFPSRLALHVASASESRAILDRNGAELLNGYGDMLLFTGTEIIRLQGAFVSTDEVNRITEFIETQVGYPETYQLPKYLDESSDTAKFDFDASDRDSMFDDAARLIVMHQQGSTSLIQRKLKLGYNRAGRIIDQLEAAGIIGPFEGASARLVNVPDPYVLEQLLENLDVSRRAIHTPKPSSFSETKSPEPTTPLSERAVTKPPVSLTKKKSNPPDDRPKTKVSFWQKLFK